MFFRLLLKLCNALFSLVLALGLILAGAYGGYALWDNSRVLSEAGNVRQELLRLKPQVDADTQEPEPLSFEAVRQINPDVCGWITLDGTRIDYPVLQGENNMSYINTDIYGDFSLAGSIFLDSRCSRDMDGAYCLLYGHHMDQGNMFGDLDKYKQEDFFLENTAGTLLLPGKSYDLTVFACLVTGASDGEIFDPGPVENDIRGLLEYAEEKAVFIRRTVLEKAWQRQDLQVIALTTCASEFTDARTIVLAVMEPHTVRGIGGEMDD